MSEHRAFDYVIVQVVPRVDRDERLTVGVILFCPTAASLGCRIALDERWVGVLAPDVDVAALAGQLDAIRAVAAGEVNAGPIASLPPSERFHWLSAPRSTVVQPSTAHAGLCDDPAAALDHLFQMTVG